jgi:O-antigen ligase
VSTTIRIPGRFPVEIACLAALAFVLPIAEAPKNILCGLYGLIWIVNRLRSGDWGGRWDIWDTLIAAWIASGFVAAAGAAFHASEWKGALDIVRYGGVLWTVKRARYGEAELRLVFLSLIASGVVGLVQGYWEVLVSHRRYWLELHSVGHVNHSSVYLAILLGATIGVTASYWQSMSGLRRTFAVATCVLFAVSLVYMSSRGAAGAEIAFLLALAIAWLRRSRRLPLAILAGLVIAVGGSIILKAGFVHKEVQQEQSPAGVLSYRGGIWALAYDEWRLHPWFGVGMDNYDQINIDAYEQEEAARHQTIDRSRYVNAPHGHSLFFNTLAERGVVGLLPLLAVLIAWFWSLGRNLPRGQSPPLVWATWTGAASALIVTLVAGAANTTLHHEQAILAGLLLAAWLSALQTLRAGVNPSAAAGHAPGRPTVAAA